MSMACGDGATSARRRGERQLHSFLRHERVSVRMALAKALHHSRDVGLSSTQPFGDTRPRAGGKRPEVLKDPGPPWVEAITVGYVAAGAPLPAVPTLGGNDGVEGTTASNLLKVALKEEKGGRGRRRGEEEDGAKEEE